MQIKIGRLRRKQGFTLIELLIVVAIIAVLAAIAVPNFLEAQVRAKVARAQSDMRSISNALEMYRVDLNGYPVVDSLFDAPHGRLVSVTTPVAYITSVPQDPFFVDDQGATIGGTDPAYVYCSGNLYGGSNPQYDKPEYYNAVYSLAGRGPDGDIVFGGYCMAHPQALRGLANIRGAYDPTNGTVSAGDILRLSAGRSSAE